MYFSTPPYNVWQLPALPPKPPPLPPNTPFASYQSWVMDPCTPIAFVICYATTVHVSNRIRRTNKKSLAICNTSAFRFAVLLHNAALCLYSAWTFLGISTTLIRCIISLYISTQGQLGLFGTFWTVLCDDRPGVFSEAMAYYGYLFYISKAYETVDTFIILFKGRQSAPLQTYHHSGAMLCMWASLRYRTPAIWVFVSFNSLIHTIMYSYYTCSALRWDVPRVLKRGLTAIQILQFLFGSVLAMSHAFVYYTKPGPEIGTGQEGCACVNDSGKLWAIMFNLAYLAPLTYIFTSSWIHSYRRTRQPSLPADKRKVAACQPVSKDNSPEDSE